MILGEKFSGIILLGDFMEKRTLLKKIAETGYNIGFGGKKHFVTYDLYRIFPRLIGSVTIMIGIIQLTDLYKDFINPYVGDLLSALLIVVGVFGLVIDFSSENKERYEEAGKVLLRLFNELRNMYHEVESLPDNSNLNSYNEEIKKITDEASLTAISRQAIGTHIITHFGFFQVMQSNWVVKELGLTRRDKFPFFHWESIFLLIVVIVVIAVLIVINY